MRCALVCAAVAVCRGGVEREVVRAALRADDGPILIGKVDDPTDPVHAKGLRPTHSKSYDGDKLLFTHRYEHHDPESDRLLYFQYHARRHEQVVVLSEIEVRSCTAMQAVGSNLTMLTLTLTPSASVSDINLTLGSIIVANSVGCMTAHGQPWHKILRERVVAEPAIQPAPSKPETVEATVLTSPASFHECFEHAYIEYYHGKPGKLDVARNARKDSLATNGLDIPWDGFASTQSVLTKALVGSKKNQSSTMMFAQVTSAPMASMQSMLQTRESAIRVLV